MRRMIAIPLLLVAVPLVIVFGTGTGGGGGSNYKVRAIFDFVRAVPGEDVKVAGAKVGKIQSLDVTPDNKAAVVLNIQKSGFSPFHRDAHCTIRPQSLIGETFVECQPGTSRSPELPKIQQGDGKGQHLLPLTNTSSPVDIDEINSIYRQPTRERLALIINEFGTALAGRGKDLNDAIHRANPALRDTDKLLAILASQNRTLARLATNSDTVLAPLARRRNQVAGFIVQANKTGQATAQVRGDISASIERLPAFLRQFRPTLVDLGNLADQATPVIRDLGTAAPGLNRFIEQLGPFSSASTPALKSLGQAADVGRPALVQAQPVANDLRQFATFADPVSKSLDDLTKSLNATGGINHFMDYLFFQMQAINGFDGVSHYLRAGLLVNLCSTYVTSPTAGCTANFTSGGSSSTAATSTNAQQALAKALGSQHPAPRIGANLGSGPQPSLLKRFLQFGNPTVKKQREAGINRIRANANGDTSPALGGADPALDYLLGN
jgi:ABC-type transporter Mla subunit MlaD